MKKRHHTVPRCYLQNFTDEAGFVWVLNTENKIFKIKPENILVENHFYTITLKNGEKSLVIEDTLANIEGAYANIFADKISQNKFLTPEERAKVSIFISAMIHRTKPNRESMRNMLQKLKGTMGEWKKQFETMTPEQRRTASAIPSSGGQSITMGDLDEYLGDFDEQQSMRLIDDTVDTAQIIFDMKWAVVSCEDPNHQFVTSDNPLVMMRPLSIKKYGRNTMGSLPGLAYQDVEVTIPLAKDKLLLAGWILNEDSYTFMPKDMSEGFNQRTILHSSEKIITSSEEQAEEIRTKYPPRSQVQK